MKRITALILVLFLCLCISACGNGATDAFGSDGTQSGQTASTDTSSRPADTTQSTAATQATAPDTSTESTGTTAPPPDHTHAFEVTVVQPTCTEDGYTYSVCECGHSVKSDELDPLGHNFTEYVSDNNATCTEDGTKTATCARCGKQDTITEEGTAKGHNFVETIVGPTTEEQGYTKHTCSNCGYTYKDNYVDKLPEEPEDNTTYPTERDDYPFGDIALEDITTDEWNEMTVEEQDEFIAIWGEYYAATNGGSWPPEAYHNYLYATKYNSYSCGWANHVCCDEASHNWLLAHECGTCGKTDCPANFVLDPVTLYTQPDYTKCPEYEDRKDPSKYCQECGLKEAGFAEPGEECCRRATKDKACSWCGEMRKANECHKCVKPGAKSASINALIPEKKRNTF